MATLETLHDTVAPIFDQVQVSVANHRKNCVALCKIHANAVKTGQAPTRGSQRFPGERRFTKVFVDMLARVLVVKKGMQPADRVVKFVGSYITYVSDKGACSPAVTVHVDMPTTILLQVSPRRHHPAPPQIPPIPIHHSRDSSRTCSNS